jgi:hypothetical protein
MSIIIYKRRDGTLAVGKLHVHVNTVWMSTNSKLGLSKSTAYLVDSYTSLLFKRTSNAHAASFAKMSIAKTSMQWRI